MKLAIAVFAVLALFPTMIPASSPPHSTRHAMDELDTLVQSGQCFKVSHAAQCLKLILQHACQQDRDIAQATHNQFLPISSQNPEIRVFEHTLHASLNSMTEWNAMLDMMHDVVFPQSFSTHFSNERHLDSLRRYQTSGYTPFMHRAVYSCPLPWVQGVSQVLLLVHGVMWIQHGQDVW